MNVMQMPVRSRQLNYVLALFLMLALAAAIFPFHADPRIVQRAKTASQGLFIVAVLLVAPRRQLIPRPTLGMLTLLLVLLGTVVGGIYSWTNVNSWETWAEYSLLAFTWWLALIAGHALGENAPSRTLEYLVLVVCASNVVLLIPRVFVLTLETRTAWGSTLWVGPLFLVYLETTNRRVRVSALVLLFASLLSTLLSGMRSQIGLTAATALAILAYVASRRRGVRRHLRRVALLTGVFALLFVLAPGRFRSEVVRLSEGALSRARASFLSADRFRLDTGGGGREAEARMAFEEFQLRDDRFARIAGFGHGFVYTYWAKGVTGHVHVTPVAFYVRYGIVGLAFYVSLFVWMGWLLLRTWRRRGRADAALAFGIQLAALLTCGGSLIAGYLVWPMAWLTIGVATGLDRRLAVSRVRLPTVTEGSAVGTAPRRLEVNRALGPHTGLADRSHSRTGT